MSAKQIKVPANRVLPIQPTEKPSPQDVMIVAQAAIDIAQRCLLNPGAVISCLKAAGDAYARNAENMGMPKDLVEQSEVLGLAIGGALLKAASQPEPESRILTPDSRLVGTDGQPIIVGPGDVAHGVDFGAPHVTGRPTPTEEESAAALAAYRAATESVQDTDAPAIEPPEETQP